MGDRNDSLSGPIKTEMGAKNRPSRRAKRSRTNDSEIQKYDRQSKEVIEMIKNRSYTMKSREEVENELDKIIDEIYDKVPNHPISYAKRNTMIDTLTWVLGRYKPDYRPSDIFKESRKRVEKKRNDQK